MCNGSIKFNTYILFSYFKESQQLWIIWNNFVAKFLYNVIYSLIGSLFLHLCLWFLGYILSVFTLRVLLSFMSGSTVQKYPGSFLYHVWPFSYKTLSKKLIFYPLIFHGLHKHI